MATDLGAIDLRVSADERGISAAFEKAGHAGGRTAGGEITSAIGQLAQRFGGTAGGGLFGIAERAGLLGAGRPLAIPLKRRELSTPPTQPPKPSAALGLLAGLGAAGVVVAKVSEEFSKLRSRLQGMHGAVERLHDRFARLSGDLAGATAAASVARLNRDLLSARSLGPILAESAARKSSIAGGLLPVTNVARRGLALTELGWLRITDTLVTRLNQSLMPMSAALPGLLDSFQSANTRIFDTLKRVPGMAPFWELNQKVLDAILAYLRRLLGLSGDTASAQAAWNRQMTRGLEQLTAGRWLYDRDARTPPPPAPPPPGSP